ncbi:MAG TPA: hypothetical protein VE074_13905 [Jatrophihabitantaceae bacterium]|nr:hypothetical protein [Jatrophihabitantaceae bacterium]
MSDSPIVGQMIRLPTTLGAAALPTTADLLASVSGVLKRHAMLTAAVAAPLTIYGFVANKRWARWAGAIAGAIAAYQYQQATALNEQASALTLQRMRAEAVAAGQ